MAFDASREAQLDEAQLTRGYWWVTHKVQVRRVTIGILLAIDLVLVGYAAFGFVDWFFLSGVRERAEMGLMTQQLTDYAGFRARNAPQNLSVEPTAVLGAGETFDLAGRITNPNMRWRAEFDYKFTYAGGETETQTGYVLPGDTKWLYALGVSGPRPGAATPVIENLRWRRIDPHVITPDYATWAKEHLDIRIENVRYEPPRPEDAVAVAKAKFTAMNATAYGYYNVGFFVALYSGTRLTGVNRVAVSELRAGEVRDVEASWFSEVPAATRIEVRPEVNVFDERAYIPVGR